MPRPQKAGIDYFPLDVYMEQDDKIALVEAKYGIVGFGTIIKLYKKIYAGKGYYYEWNERSMILFTKYAGVEYQKLKAIVSDALEWEIFDKKLFYRYKILTSKRIQKTYLDASHRKKQVELYEEFLLNGVNGYINKENVIINVLNDDNNPQIKVKESKVNKTKDVDTKTIFDFWNSKGIIKHKNLDQATSTKLTAKLKSYSLKEIKQSIHNYAVVVDDSDSFFNYRWTLKDFLQRGFEKFLDKDVVFDNYLNKDKK